VVLAVAVVTVIVRRVLLEALGAGLSNATNTSDKM
jgi:hypothetical protein